MSGPGHVPSKNLFTKIMKMVGPKFGLQAIVC